MITKRDFILRGSCERLLDIYVITLLIKLTAAQNEVALSYHRVRGLYFLAVVFAAILATFHVNNTNKHTHDADTQ